MKQAIWHRFISWWSELVETAQAEEKWEDRVRLTFPEGMVGDCETYKHVVYLQSLNRTIESEHGKAEREEQLSEVISCHMTKIYAVEDFGVWGQHTEPDVRMYCESCWEKLEDDSAQQLLEAGPSESDEARSEMKNFVKFFRNWFFGVYEDAQAVETFNNTHWTTAELMEIFSVLRLYVITDDVLATKFDKHMDAWRALAQAITEVANEETKD